MRTTQLQVGNEPIDVWIAETYPQRQLGLMWVQAWEMADNQGMLFVFEPGHRGSFWMKNTLIPLDVAFIQDNGDIVHTDRMEPLSLDPHGPVGPYRFALELWAGTLDRLGVYPGDSIRIPDTVLQP